MERDAIPQFLQQLSKMADIILVPGNHDGNMGHLVPSTVRMMTAKGILLEDTLLLHGHTTPSRTGNSVKRIIMGHAHPIFLRKGSVMSGQRIWVYLVVDKQSIFSDSKGFLEIVVLPSFNKYLYYSSATNHYRRSISPILKKAVNRIEKATVLTLDGSVVGNGSLLDEVI